MFPENLNFFVFLFQRQNSKRAKEGDGGVREIGGRRGEEEGNEPKKMLIKFYTFLIKRIHSSRSKNEV